MESFSGSVLVLTRQKLIQKATVAHCSGSPRFVLVTAEMIKKNMFPLFLEKKKKNFVMGRVEKFSLVCKFPL